MKRVLIDTNVYIDWMHAGGHELVMTGPGFVRYLSAVVLMELEAGASSLAAARAVAELARTFDKTSRLVVPSRAVWARAGTVLRQLHERRREVRRASVENDVLIALSARDIGATLVTRDRSDYDAIRKYVEFSCLSLPSS